MLGAEQRDWLLEELATTKARWNVLAQQTGFAPINRATDVGPRNFTAGADNWDGYVAERQQILDWMVEQQTSNPVVLTGDTHQNWVRNVPPDFRSLDGPPVATEFMGTSISTDGDPAVPRSVYAATPTTRTSSSATTTAATCGARSRRSMDERVPDGDDGRAAASVGLDAGDLRDRERAGGS